MIKSFASKALKRFYDDDDKSRLQAEHVDRIGNILSLLDVASDVQDLNIPSYRLHPLKGKLRGYWAVTVRANWRIIFKFEGGDAFDVDLVDYH